MRKKKSVLNLCRKKSFKTEKSYRRSLGLNKDSNCRIPIKQSTISFKKRKYQQTPLKSPRIKSFTPSKPPRNKKLRKLDFGHHQCAEEDTTFDPQIPSEMLIFKSSSPDASLTLENEMHGNINDYGYEHGLSDESVEPNVCKDDIEEMIKLMPSVLECLASVGLGNVFLDYFRQLNSGVQKPDNISFLLWTDVIQWYKHETASSMRYNNETKTFWKLGWKLFGVGFLNYMSGFKNESQIIEGLAKRGKCEPEKSNINFIVPAVGNLRAFSPYDEIIQGGRKPGIFKDVMEFMASSWKNSSLCLTFDGKKLKQGLGKDSGDIDLLGYEDGPSMRFKLRRRLLGLINFGEFPPPGQYVDGWPTQLFEALLANIDAKLLLYSLCKSGTYNSRAFSSMMGETFFSEMTHQDRAGHGVISCDEFSKYIGKTTEQLQALLDTSRTFVYRTSTKVKAYDPVSSDMNLEDLPLNDNTTESLDSDRFHIRHIKLKDHFFDSEERRRRAGTRRHGTVSTNRNALQKGSLGVRWYRARRDDSKLLPTKKTRNI